MKSLATVNCLWKIFTENRPLGKSRRILNKDFVILFNDVHFMKELLPFLVTDGGINISSNEEQS